VGGPRYALRFGPGRVKKIGVEVMNSFFPYQLVGGFSIHGDALDLNWFQLCTRVLCSATVRESTRFQFVFFSLLEYYCLEVSFRRFYIGCWEIYGEKVSLCLANVLLRPSLPRAGASASRDTCGGRVAGLGVLESNVNPSGNPFQTSLNPHSPAFANHD